MAMECTDEAGVVYCARFWSKQALVNGGLEAASDVIAKTKVSPEDINHLGHNRKTILGSSLRD